ncbi:DUF2867 domain-containing protein [Cryptosporangium sp. NPDC048952]|uniref:DUF2867 domain-containing protein n=1 Tax=Cryptosporangium sp. NPDC048952 TaxID=3363961 RepID=UPI003711FF8D
MPVTTPVDVPADAVLLHERFGEPRPGDLVDAYAVRLTDAHPRDPHAWAKAVFFDPPPWVRVALGVRNALVGLIGVERGDRSSFATESATDREVLLGTDAGHLDFRASVLVDTDRVVLSTHARPVRTRGTIYLLPVRALHPLVVRAMLSRAATRL